MHRMIKMRYKDFEFDQNPAQIKVASAGIQAVHPVTGAVSVVDGICRKPTVVSGKGSFFGTDAVCRALLLRELLFSQESGWLFVPSAPPMRAFFTDFTSECNTQKNCVLYTFAFTEDCSERKEKFDFGYTVAEAEENAFDIANRTGVSVDAIMRCNSYPTPFDVQKGDQVMLQ